MAGGYKATLQVKCWKEQTCCYCGAVYRHLLSRDKTGYGPSQQAAAEAATAAATRTLAGETAMRPCPACGNYQPEMIGAHRLSRHGRFFLLTVLAFGLLLLLGASGLIPQSVAMLLLLPVAGVVLIANTWVGARNPNGNPRANKPLAERLVGQRVVQLVSAEKDREDRARPVTIETGAGFWFAFLLLGTTLSLMLGGELLRLARGAPANTDWHPPAFGPGDTAWTWVTPEKPIESIRGYWRATASTGKILNGKDLGMGDNTPLTVTSQTSSGADRVSATDPRQNARLWASVTFPTSAQLVGKKVSIELKLTVTVPDVDPDQKDKVIERTEDVVWRTEAQLGPHRAGFLSRFFWYIGMIGGGLLFVLAGIYHLLRDAALKAMALPSRVIPATEEELAEPVPLPPAEERKEEKQPEKEPQMNADETR
jgi:hypothetical protein